MSRRFTELFEIEKETRIKKRKIILKMTNLNNNILIMKSDMEKCCHHSDNDQILWLVVCTHLKNISQNGNLPQIGVKINKYLKPPPRLCFHFGCPMVA